MSPRQPGGGRARLSRWRTHRPAVPLRVACVCVCVCVSSCPPPSPPCSPSLSTPPSWRLSRWRAHRRAVPLRVVCVCVCVCVCLFLRFPVYGSGTTGRGRDQGCPGVREHFTKLRTGARQKTCCKHSLFCFLCLCCLAGRTPPSRFFPCWMCQRFHPCHPQHEDLLSHIQAIIVTFYYVQGH